MIQWVGGHNNYGQHNTGHIHTSSYVLGIVETFDLHLAYGEGKNKSNNLQQHLVAVENAKEDVSTLRVTDINTVVGDVPQSLKKQ